MMYLCSREWRIHISTNC